MGSLTQFLIVARSLKKVICLVFLFSISSLSLLAQQGFGTNAPSEHAVLHMVSVGQNQGVIIPQVTSSNRPLADATIKGMMVFNVTDTEFQLCDGTQWITVTNNTGDNLGNHTAQQSINLNGHWLSGDGGNEGIFVDNVGNVGIGLSTPNAPLDIHKSGVSGELLMLDIRHSQGTANDIASIRLAAGNGDNSGTFFKHMRQGSSGGDFGIFTSPTVTADAIERLRIFKDGGVSIGGSVKDESLTVSGTTKSQYFQIGNPGANSFFEIAPNSSSAIGIYAQPDGTPDQVLKIQNVTGAGQSSLQLGNFHLNYPSLSFMTDDNTGFSGGVVDGEFHLVSNSNKVLTVTDNDFVGIGTVSPNTSLQVSSGLSTPMEITSSNTSSTIRFANSGSTSSAESIGTNGNSLIFQTTGSTRMAITNAGNVGIGTNTPAGKLNVVATSNVQSDIFAVHEYRGTNGSSGKLFTISEVADAGVLRLGYYGLSGSGLFTVDGGSNNGGPDMTFTRDNTNYIHFSSRVGGKNYINNGNFGLGTNTPSEQLHVKGDIRIENTSEGVGKVLVSDANGVGSWEGAGAIYHGVVTKTANYTATGNDDIIFVDATSNDVTITLPSAVGRTGKMFRIKKIDTSGNHVIVDGNGGETIDDVATKSTNVYYTGYVLVSNGTNWMIVGRI